MVRGQGIHSFLSVLDRGVASVFTFYQLTTITILHFASLQHWYLLHQIVEGKLEMNHAICLLFMSWLRMELFSKFSKPMRICMWYNRNKDMHGACISSTVRDQCIPFINSGCYPSLNLPHYSGLRCCHPSRTTDVQSTEGDVTHFYMCSWLHIMADTAQTAQKQLTWIS